MKRTLLFLTVFLTAAMIANAETVTITESLAVKTGLENNPALLSAQKIAEGTDAASHKSYWLPNPMLGVELMGIKSYTTGFSQAMTKQQDISQKVPFPLKFYYSALAAHDSSDMAMWSYEMKKRETEKDIRLSYYALYKITKTIETNNETVSLLKQVSKIAASRADTSMDSVKADIEYARLKNELTSLKEQKKTAAAMLNRAAGSNLIAENSDFIIEPPVIPELKMSLNDIRSAVLLKASAIRTAESWKNMAANMRNGEIAGYLPDLNITLKKQIEPGSDDYEIMFEAEIPLWFFSNQQSDIAKAGSGADAADKNYESEKQRILYEAYDHYQTIKSDFRTLNLYGDVLIPQAEAAFRASVASYQSKKSDFMSMIYSEKMVLDMRQDYYMHMQEYLMHFRMLEELAGSME
jgi:outer membrane protein TolC